MLFKPYCRLKDIFGPNLIKVVKIGFYNEIKLDILEISWPERVFIFSCFPSSFSCIYTDPVDYFCSDLSGNLETDQVVFSRVLHTYSLYRRQKLCKNYFFELKRPQN